MQRGHAAGPGPLPRGVVLPRTSCSYGKTRLYLSPPDDAGKPGSQTRLRRCSTTNCTQAGCGNALLSLGELEGSTARLQEVVAPDRRGFRGFRASPTKLAAKICASFYSVPAGSAAACGQAGRRCSRMLTSFFPRRCRPSPSRTTTPHAWISSVPPRPFAGEPRLWRAVLGRSCGFLAPPGESFAATSRPPDGRCAQSSTGRRTRRRARSR